jgi:hypothetical protein
MDSSDSFPLEAGSLLPAPISEGRGAIGEAVSGRATSVDRRSDGFRPAEEVSLTAASVFEIGSDPSQGPKLLLGSATGGGGGLRAYLVWQKWLSGLPDVVRPQYV